jgi:hypothetical protein
MSTDDFNLSYYTSKGLSDFEAPNDTGSKGKRFRHSKTVDATVIEETDSSDSLDHTVISSDPTKQQQQQQQQQQQVCTICFFKETFRINFGVPDLTKKTCTFE